MNDAYLVLVKARGRDYALKVKCLTTLLVFLSALDETSI